MKKLIIPLLLFVSLASFGQTQIVSGTDSYYVWLPYQSQQVHQSDSVQISATILTNGSVSGISWTQTAGPTVTIAPSFSTRVGIMGQSSFWLQGLTPGTYIFTATATVNGKSFSTTDTVNIVANATCPTITGAQLTLFGQTLTLPVGSLILSMSNKTTQSY